jgi:hypothetical protein
MNGGIVSFEALRAASRLVGRRTALRCLAVGVGASLLAACKGGDESKPGKRDGGSDAAGGGGDHGTGGSGGTGTGGVAAQSFAAFVRGSWKITSESTNEERFTYTATVGDGVWTLDFGQGATERGTWALQGGRLVLGVPERFAGGDLADGQTEEAAAENVPATVGDSVSLFLPWQAPGLAGLDDEQRLDVNYDKKSGVLRIRHIEPGGMTTHTCTRA